MWQYNYLLVGTGRYAKMRNFIYLAIDFSQFFLKIFIRFFNPEIRNLNEG